MPHKITLPLISAEDAQDRLVEWIRAQHESNQRHAQPQRLVVSIRAMLEPEYAAAQRRYKDEHGITGMAMFEVNQDASAIPYYIAAWELVRRGLVSPAMNFHRDIASRLSGDEFWLTDFGAAWLDKVAPTVSPSDHTRFARHLRKHSALFRPSFQTRSAEALECYRAGLYFSSCVMAGAAAESILITLAVAVKQDEATVLALYARSGGAKKVRDLVTHGRSAEVTRQLDALWDLLKYWRDEAAHAGHSEIGEEEAYYSLLLLWRLARFGESIVGELRKRSGEA